MGGGKLVTLDPEEPDMQEVEVGREGLRRPDNHARGVLVLEHQRVGHRDHLKGCEPTPPPRSPAPRPEPIVVTTSRTTTMVRTASVSAQAASASPPEAQLPHPLRPSHERPQHAASLGRASDARARGNPGLTRPFTATKGQGNPFHPGGNNGGDSATPKSVSPL